MIKRGIALKGAKVLLLGITFKENCPDFRNSKVKDIYSELIRFGLNVQVYDPLANRKELFNKYSIKLNNSLQKYEAIILAVAHKEFLSLDPAHSGKLCYEHYLNWREQ